MAQFFWTAEDYELNSTPAAFANALDIPTFVIKKDATGRKYLEVTGADKTPGFLTFLGAGSIIAQDCQIAVTFLGQHVDCDNQFFIRADDLDGTETYISAAYLPVVNEERIFQKTDDVSETLTQKSLSVPVSTVGCCRVQGVGATVKTKQWVETDPEPDWTLSAETTTVQNGAVGIGRYREVLRVYTFGVGTEGDTAPLKPLEPPLGIPQNLAGTPTATSILASWDSVPGATKYTLQWRRKV